MNKVELKKYLVRKGAETEDSVNEMTNYQLFNRFLTWHGLIEWADTIIEVYKAAFESDKKEQPVSENLKKAANTYMNEEIDNGADYVDQDGDYYFYATGLEYAFKAGANWQKQQLMKDAINITPDTEWDDIIKMLRSKLTGNEKLIIIKED